MSGSKSSASRLATVFLWAEISLVSCEALSDLLEISYRRHVLAIPRVGSGLLRAAGREYVLELGKCFIFPPETTLQISNLSEYPLSVYLLEFVEMPLSQGRQQASMLLEGGEFRVVPSARFIDLASSLYENREAAGEAEAYGNHLLFQKMVHHLLASEAKEKDGNAMQAVKRTIEHMQASYSLDLTHAQLAEMAGLSMRHYSRLFLKMTGKSPIEYLIAQRMNRASQLLLTSEDSIQEIAASVGFHDPFHFSRSFKQHMNVSPRLYIHLRKQNIRVISMQFLGEMLALGVKPVGAPGILLRGGYLRREAAGIEEVGPSVINPDMDKLEALKPDAILTFDGHHYERYAKIAPTLSMPWSLPFFERFRRIAEWIGKRDQAEQWISAYVKQAQEIREQLSPWLAERSTVSFFWSRGLPRTFQAYYDMSLLYRDLGFHAPLSVARIQQVNGHPFKADIPLQEMSQYAGDHIFVVVSGDTHAQRAMRELENSEPWQRLPAVRNGRVYRVTEDWLFEDPISRMGQLQAVLQIMKLQ